ncbi:hypothetical protein Slin14017_G100770 [Septoria linicola]|nr:hypothetical protein Slin14017_G100770 [Septoria linicola]
MSSNAQYQSSMDALVILRNSASDAPTTAAATISPARSVAAPPASQTANTAPLSASGNGSSPFVWTKLADKTVSLFASQVDIGDADFLHIVEILREQIGVAPTFNEVRARVTTLRQDAEHKKQAS